jgi:hypothetical protein
MDIIKNPVIIGLVVGILTYVYMMWTEKEKIKKMKNKNKKYKKSKINLVIPIVITILVWFISYSYFEYKRPHELTDIQSLNILPDITRNLNQMTPLPLMPTQNYKFVGDVLSASSDAKSFSLITNGITVPTKLPEVLLEMY